MINYIEKFLLVIFGIKKKPLCEERLLFYIEKFLLVIFGIKKKPLCEERLLFYVSVSHSLLSGICSASSLGLVPARVCLLLRLCQNNYIGLAQLFPE